MTFELTSESQSPVPSSKDSLKSNFCLTTDPLPSDPTVPPLATQAAVLYGYIRRLSLCTSFNPHLSARALRMEVKVRLILCFCYLKTIYRPSLFVFGSAGNFWNPQTYICIFSLIFLTCGLGIEEKSRSRSVGEGSKTMVLLLPLPSSEASDSR